MKYLTQFLIILGFTLTGEVLQRIIPLPIPASVYGLLLLFLALCFGLIKLEQVKETGAFLTSILPILFVSPAVGIVEDWGLIRDDLIPILLLLVASTVLTFGISGRIESIFRHRRRGCVLRPLIVPGRSRRTGRRVRTRLIIVVVALTVIVIIPVTAVIPVIAAVIAVIVPVIVPVSAIAAVIAIPALAGGTVSFIPAAEELNHFGNNTQLGAFAAAFAVIPLVQLKPAFDHNGGAFFQKTFAVFCRFIPNGNVHKTGFRFFLPVGHEPAVYRQAELTDSRAGRCIAQIRIACKIADKKNFIQRCHDKFLF